MSYRADIDGLRAVAVLAVVGFHASPVRFSGGFVGVDVFFVISGLLISTILFESFQENRPDLIGFYGRRIRRIFPALSVVLATTFLAGFLVLTPDELSELGKHILGGAGFVSNFVLWNDSGYFDVSADSKPLLHLWSLGIEEQFYIIWPALLWLAWRARIRWVIVVAICAGLSFAVNIWQVQSDTVAAFYSPLSRFWEILAGAGLACLLSKERPVLVRGTIADAASFAGLLILIGSVVVMDTSRAFPGWWALMPVSGSVVLIASGAGALVNRHLLSNRLLVGIGLISYPLYLWHWPLLSLTRIIAGEEDPGRIARTVAVGAAVALAWLTYAYIEKPVRNRRFGLAAAYSVMAMMIVGIFGLSAFQTDGFPRRGVLLQQVVKNQGELGHKEFWNYLDAHFFQCPSLADAPGSLQWDGASLRCRQSRGEMPVHLVIIGDSHAESLFPGLAERLTDSNVAYYTKGGLPFLDDADFALMFRHVIADRDIEIVILSAYWHFRIDRKTSPDAPLDPAARLSAAVSALISAGKRVYVALDVPDFPFQPRKCKFERSVLSESKCIEPRSAFDTENAAANAMIAETARQNPSMRTLDPARAICDATDCNMALGGLLLFRDPNHLGLNGSRLAADAMMASESLAALKR